MKIFLYGPSGSGKSTTGKILAEHLNIPFIDLDQQIEIMAGEPISEIFSLDGEAAFRKLERQALLNALKISTCVVALGGGALLENQNRKDVEENGAVFCLMASLKTLVKRLMQDVNQRPLLRGGLENRLKILLTKRSPHYASFINQIDTEALTPNEAAWKIQVRLGSFHIRGMGQGYDVRVEAGQYSRIGKAMMERGLKGPVAVVTDENVAVLYGEVVRASLEEAGYQVRIIPIPPGEHSKNLEMLNHLWGAFLQGGLERGSTVLALGGGVVGDLAGFAAATYLRGVGWVNMPTSLLAMVDSSLGGKTGIDLPQGKNLVGAFHAPRLVWVDPELLKTLPESELRNGMAEVVKHGMIGDPELFDLCAGGWQVIHRNLNEIVRRALAVKVKVINEDPYEKGLRQVLNLGHTVGHGVENVSGFRVLHGEAVSIGMVAAARIAQREGIAERGLAERLEQVLSQLGLPVEIPADLERKDILKVMLLDKKRSNGRLHFALPVRVGEVHYGIEVDDVEEILQRS